MRKKKSCVCGYTKPLEKRPPSLTDTEKSNQTQKLNGKKNKGFSVSYYTSFFFMNGKQNYKKKNEKILICLSFSYSFTLYG